jgi:hypothetical protein
MLGKVMELLRELLRIKFVGKVVIHFAPPGFIRKVEKTEIIDLK